MEGHKEQTGHPFLGSLILESPVQLEARATHLLQGDAGDATAAPQAEGKAHWLIQIHEMDVHLTPCE